MVSQYNSVNNRLQYYEKKFQQIAIAASQSSPRAIVNKFEVREQLQKQISDEIEAKSRRVVDAIAQLVRERVVVRVVNDG